MTSGPSRCAVCLWALYDGATCQNKDCIKFGREGQSVRMSNASAAEELAKRGKLPRPAPQK